MLVGFVTNFFIGIFAYLILRGLTNLRQIDAATVAGYYGSDSAGTYVTCIGVLTTLHIAYAAYMPVMLAVMEIPGGRRRFQRPSHGLLCLFLLEMGVAASRKRKDLRTAGWKFIAFGLIAPNVFAVTGMTIACIDSQITRTPLQHGTYVGFAVLCGAGSYIAVQRLAIPEVSPTLPLVASLGLTFSYNVTFGIPIYLQVAKIIMEQFPVT